MNCSANIIFVIIDYHRNTICIKYTYSYIFLMLSAHHPYEKHHHNQELYHCESDRGILLHSHQTIFLNYLYFLILNSVLLLKSNSFSARKINMCIFINIFYKFIIFNIYYIHIFTSPNILSLFLKKL